jgi:hypothetical protein
MSRIVCVTVRGDVARVADESRAKVHQCCTPASLHRLRRWAIARAAEYTVTETNESWFRVRGSGAFYDDGENFRFFGYADNGGALW